MTLSPPLIAATSLFAALTLAAPERAGASPYGVGLGVAAGVALPDANVDFDPAFNWGFYVDIPLISTFHISPSALVYRLDQAEGGGLAATDVSLNFKFMIPLGLLDLFAGVTAGLTSTAELDPHIGALGGVSVNLISNVDVFAQANYRIIIEGNTNIRDLMIFAGPLFRFQ